MARKKKDKTPKPETPEVPATSFLCALINGKVQSMGVRSAIAGEAKKRNITGTAANRADGSVEIRAFGNTHDIEELLSFLKRAPHDNKNLTQVVYNGAIPKMLPIPLDFDTTGIIT